mmetsp:Transcript_20975/g.35951  ORF Transcript_20975/g.35951 Transcript_20975/m.35951 type:complete len:111 (+) Transcript_20975:3201-3533(+)
MRHCTVSRDMGRKSHQTQLIYESLPTNPLMPPYVSETTEMDADSQTDCAKAETDEHSRVPLNGKEFLCNKACSALYNNANALCWRQMSPMGQRHILSHFVLLVPSFTVDC